MSNRLPRMRERTTELFVVDAAITGRCPCNAPGYPPSVTPSPTSPIPNAFTVETLDEFSRERTQGAIRYPLSRWDTTHSPYRRRNTGRFN